MVQFMNKIHKLQTALAPLRKKYNDVLQKVDTLREELAILQDQKAQAPSDPSFIAKEQELRAEFIHWNRAANQYMSQKAKEDWINLGDANTRHFHSLMKKKQYHQRVYTITTASGEILTDYSQVINQFRNYYPSLSGTTPSKSDTIELLAMDEGPVLSFEQQLMLLKPVTESDIRTAIWSIPEHKSLGPDGFGSGFFKKAWAVIGPDVVHLIQKFFSNWEALTKA